MCEGPEKLADSMVNPPERWVYKLHDEWCREQYGDAPGTINFERYRSHQKFTINYERLIAQMVNQLKIAVNIHCLKEGMKLFLGFGYLPDTFFRTILG